MWEVKHTPTMCEVGHVAASAQPLRAAMVNVVENADLEGCQTISERGMLSHPDTMVHAKHQPTAKRAPLMPKQNLGLVERFKESKAKPVSYKYDLTTSPSRRLLPASEAHASRLRRTRKLTKFDILDKENAGPL